MKTYTVAGPNGLQEMTLAKIAEQWIAGELSAEHHYRQGTEWRSLGELSEEIEAARPLVQTPPRPEPAPPPTPPVQFRRAPETPILATIFYLAACGFAGLSVLFAMFTIGQSASTALLALVVGMVQALFLAGIGQVIALIGRIEFNTRKKDQL